MGVETVERYHHGDLRAALLKAAGELIAEDGVEALTLRACARRAGVSHGAPAHHFGNITGLLTEFAVEGFQRLTATMSTVGSKGSGDALLAAGLGYIQFAMRAPEQFRIMWRSELLDSSSERLQGAIRDSRQYLCDVLDAAHVRQYGIPLTASSLASRFELAWCCVHGYACVWVEGRRKSRSLVEAERMLRMIGPLLLARSDDPVA
jgi:AcrR family transcriptional regulator